MKKSSMKIGKKVLEALLFLVGMFAFLCMVGEPTEEWYNWAGRLFGSLSGISVIAVKAFCGLVIFLLIKAEEALRPELFKKA